MAIRALAIRQVSDRGYIATTRHCIGMYTGVGGEALAACRLKFFHDFSHTWQKVLQQAAVSARTGMSCTGRVSMRSLCFLVVPSPGRAFRRSCKFRRIDRASAHPLSTRRGARMASPLYSTGPQQYRVRPLGGRKRRSMGIMAATLTPLAPPLCPALWLSFASGQPPGERRQSVELCLNVHRPSPAPVARDDRAARDRAPVARAGRGAGDGRGLAARRARAPAVRAGPALRAGDPLAQRRFRHLSPCGARGDQLLRGPPAAGAGDRRAARLRRRQSRAPTATYSSRTSAWW